MYQHIPVLHDHIITLGHVKIFQVPHGMPLYWTSKFVLPSNSCLTQSERDTTG